MFAVAPGSGAEKVGLGSGDAIVAFTSRDKRRIYPALPPSVGWDDSYCSLCITRCTMEVMRDGTKVMLPIPD